MNLKKALSSTFLILSSGPLQFVGALIALYMADQLIVDNFTWCGWILLFFTSTLLMSLGFVSSSVTFGIAAYFWGWSTFPMLFIAYIASSYVGYWIGTKLGAPLLSGLTKKNKRVNKLLSNLATASFLDLFMIRIPPVLPFSMVNYAMGGSNVKLSNFMIAGTAGMIPRAALAFFLGTSASSIQQIVQGGVMTGNQKIGITITAIISIGYLVYRFRFSQNKKAPTNS